MIPDADNTSMFTIIFLIGIFAVCLLAPFFGADSRYDERGRHHRRTL
jgi:hypothetical protein